MEEQRRVNSRTLLDFTEVCEVDSVLTRIMQYKSEWGSSPSMEDLVDLKFT